MYASETAFVQRSDYRIRYFTPNCEVPLCGHATLASAHILSEQGYIPDGKPFILKAQDHDLQILPENGWIKMTFPVYTLTKIENHEYLDSLLGAKIKEAFKTEHGWVLARLADEATLAKACPDFAGIQKRKGLVMIVATAISAVAEYDFAVRVFCNPDYGIQEDPVTGAANCILAPYWHMESGKEIFFSRQISTRGGEMKIHLLNDKVEIAGQAITAFSITLNF